MPFGCLLDLKLHHVLVTHPFLFQCTDANQTETTICPDWETLCLNARPFTVCTNADWLRLHIVLYRECRATVTNSPQCHIWRTAYILNPLSPTEMRAAGLTRFLVDFTGWKDQDLGQRSWGHLCPARTHSSHGHNKARQTYWWGWIGKACDQEYILITINQLKVLSLWEAGILQRVYEWNCKWQGIRMKVYDWVYEWNCKWHPCFRAYLSLQSTSPSI